MPATKNVTAVKGIVSKPEKPVSVADRKTTIRTRGRVLKGIDTNVLVRYLVQDDPKQAKKATSFIEGYCTVDEPCFIDPIVLSELVWVQESNYKQIREEIVHIIEQLL